MVDAVRSIPGRRFDWDSKEWWALQADGTAPYVKGVIERHAWLRVVADVEAWLAEAVTGWVGRVRRRGTTARGSFVLDTISGELPDGAGAAGGERGGRLWLPFSAEVPTSCGDARRALRRARACAARSGCGSGWSPRRPRCR